MNLQENIERINEITVRINEEDIDYSENTENLIKRMITKMDLPKLEYFEVEWSEKWGAYVISLFYEKNDEYFEISHSNETKLINVIRPFLGLPGYSIVYRNYYVPSKTKE